MDNLSKNIVSNNFKRINMNIIVSFLFLIITNVSLVFCNPTVPVLFLSNLQFKINCPSMDHKPEDYLTKILQHIPNLYIIVEKKLSPEDFSNLSEQSFLINSDKINYCASITNNLVLSLNYGQYNKFILSSNDTASLQKYIQESTKNVFPSMYYIYFEDDHVFDRRSDMIIAHKKILENICHLFGGSSKPFLVVYTALEPSWVFKSKHGKREKRNAGGSPTHITEKKFMLYIREAIVLKVSPSYSQQTSKVELGSCAFQSIAENPSQIQLKCSDREVSLDYSSSKNSWSITAIRIKNKDFVKSLQGEDISFYLREINVPYGYSYHCSEIMLAQNVPKSAQRLSVTIKGFQIQLFDESADGQSRFDESYDCTGWTTIPILAGLFVSAILLIILGIGVVMMLDLRANDRFDNPKQKRAASFLIRN